MVVVPPLTNYNVVGGVTSVSLYSSIQIYRINKYCKKIVMFYKLLKKLIENVITLHYNKTKQNVTKINKNC